MSRAKDKPALTLDDLRQRATITIPEAAAFLGISSDLCYEAARRSELPCVAYGRRRLVVVRRLLAQLGLEGEGRIEVDDGC